MSSPSEESIKAALQSVTDPATGKDVVSAGLITGIVLREGKAGFVLTADSSNQVAATLLAAACEAAVRKIPGIVHVTAVTTGEARPPQEPRKPANWNTTPVEGVNKIIAIASGKGGVGKSTTAVNLALALARSGKRAGLLDADIYGPSIPLMMGISATPEIQNGKMVPPTAQGIQCMSIAFITGEQAAVMRGPMISKTLTQLLRFTHWGAPGAPLDFLIADMPPGTGDVHLSMAQAAAISGAVIVTTPQNVALLDARKAAAMFLKVNIPILGVVENMSGSVFGSGGGKKLAAELSVPLLATIPMDEVLVKATDAGTPYAGKNLALYDAIAKML